MILIFEFSIPIPHAKVQQNRFSQLLASAKVQEFFAFFVFGSAKIQEFPLYRCSPAPKYRNSRPVCSPAPKYAKQFPNLLSAASKYRNSRFVHVRQRQSTGKYARVVFASAKVQEFPPHGCLPAPEYKNSRLACSLEFRNHATE